MRYSKLFGKTIKNISSEINLVSHQLLIKGGFIRESTAGRYFFLPLGMKVRDKIMKIVEEEMDSIGCQKMITPTLHPIELWEETNRTSSVGFELMQVKDRRGAKFALGGTAEEMMVDVVRKFNISYKDLPFTIYQFSQKFRDEKRARGGLLRTREFMMKDAYSFHYGENDFTSTYDQFKTSYSRIFKSCGLDTVIVEADNGYIGGEYCHEFVVESLAGESKYFISEDNKAIHEDIATFRKDIINKDDELLPFEIFDQPEWVKTMDDCTKYFNLPKSRFLKNVVYKGIKDSKIYIATIRGDLEVNKTKLEHVLNMIGELEEASDDDLISIGTKPGYVHSWGHKGVIYVGDDSLKTVNNFIGGYKTETQDSRNVNYGRDFTCEVVGDIAMATDQSFGLDGEKLLLKKGIEVGNIFQLGTHYSSKMNNAVFTDENGKEKPFYMGCYGIGIGRTMATIVEKHSDDRGIIWPKNVSPYNIHLLFLGENKDTISECEKLYSLLNKNDFTVLYDDRVIQPSLKLMDADLIGINLRVLISDRTIKENKVEIKKRSEKESFYIELDYDKIINSLRDLD